MEEEAGSVFLVWEHRVPLEGTGLMEACSSPLYTPGCNTYFLLLGPEEKEEKISSALVSPTPLLPC